ncbi:MAG TPA: D-alanyl-D-alanine carboxypeptidase family protein [Nitrospiraceae bacterium]|jgi:D-alanyl-D-alanine carboxypeptidase (penicillin-binding protein 5/6)
MSLASTTVLSMLAGVATFALLSFAPLELSRATHAHTAASLTPTVLPTSNLKSLPLFRRHRTQAHSILLKDLSTGRTLYEVGANRRVAPASLTKIMSALVILEYGQLHDPVTVSRKAARARKIHLRLHAGHVFRLGDLLKAMLITSANDACLAAVEHVGGSEEMFVAMMNNKAHRLGLLDTHFSNACGFDSPTHYTTAGDLATLSEAAMEDPTFRALVRKEVDMIFPLNANRSYWLRSTNRLLGRIPGVEGIKTGFTSQAGRCLVAKVSQDGKEVLLVLLHANRRWDTASTLLRQGIQSLQ